MKIGIYQCKVAGRSAAGRIDVLRSYMEGQDVDILVCPELFATGYDDTAHYEDLAESPDGPFAAQMKALAKDTGTAIVYGYPERGEGVLYNSAALFSREGELLANHRKRLASPHSFEEKTFTNGPSVTFADIGEIRVAIIICYEVEFPESIRQAAQGGAHAVLVPTALGRDWGFVAEKTVPARAFENGIWLAYADHAGEEGSLRFYGGSRIVAPDGEETKISVGEEGFATVELDITRMEASRARIPYLRDCRRL